MGLEPSVTHCAFPIVPARSRSSGLKRARHRRPDCRFPTTKNNKQSQCSTLPFPITHTESPRAHLLHGREKGHFEGSCRQGWREDAASPSSSARCPPQHAAAAGVGGNLLNRQLHCGFSANNCCLHSSAEQAVAERIHTKNARRRDSAPHA